MIDVEVCLRWCRFRKGADRGAFPRGLKSAGLGALVGGINDLTNQATTRQDKRTLTGQPPVVCFFFVLPCTQFLGAMKIVTVPFCWPS